MKKTFTFLIAVFSFGAAMAQPVLNSSNITIGDEYLLYNITGISPANMANSGANQNWSTTSGTATLGGSALFMNPSATPYGATYPAANVALRIILGSDTVYHLFKNAAGTGFEEVATDMGTNSSPDIFTSYRTLLPATFNFTDSIGDAYEKQGQGPSTAFIRYDAWGTLTTADSVYTNLGRVFRNDTRGNTNVIWWNQNGRAPVLIYDGTLLLYWKKKASTPTSVTGEPNGISFRVYPNPAQHTLYINSSERIDAVSITDLSGKVLLQSTTGSVDIRSLSGGLYLVRVESGNKQSFTRFVKH